MVIYQGNTYKLPIKLKISGKSIVADDVKKVEFAFGDVIKTYPEQATFKDETFIVPLTQEDTFSLDETEKAFYQVRVYFNDTSVKCTVPKKIEVKSSVSKAVFK